MKKFGIVLLIAAVCVFSFAGCKNKNASSSDSGDSWNTISYGKDDYEIQGGAVGFNNSDFTGDDSEDEYASEPEINSGSSGSASTDSSSLDSSEDPTTPPVSF